MIVICLLILQKSIIYVMFSNESVLFGAEY